MSPVPKIQFLSLALPCRKAAFRSWRAGGAQSLSLLPAGVCPASLRGCLCGPPELCCAAGRAEAAHEHDCHQQLPASAEQLHHRPAPPAAYRERKHQGRERSGRSCGPESRCANLRRLHFPSTCGAANFLSQHSGAEAGGALGGLPSLHYELGGGRKIGIPDCVFHP